MSIAPAVQDDHKFPPALIPLLAASPEDAAALRVAVTSPGGTTQAALSVLMDPDAWPASLSKAIAAATVRSRELAG